MAKNKLPEEVSVSEFKARALELFELVSKTGKTIRVTKRKKLIAQVLPFSGNAVKPRLGWLAGTIIKDDDIISPIADDDWEVNL